MQVSGAAVCTLCAGMVALDMYLTVRTCHCCVLLPVVHVRSGRLATFLRPWAAPASRAPRGDSLTPVRSIELASWFLLSPFALSVRSSFCFFGFLFGGHCSAVALRPICNEYEPALLPVILQRVLRVAQLVVRANPARWAP